MNFNQGFVTNVTFKKVGKNCGTFQEALENRHNEFHRIYNEFHRICGLKHVAMKTF